MSQKRPSAPQANDKQTPNQFNKELEAALQQLRPYLTAEEIAHARTLKTVPEVNKFLTNCVNRHHSEGKQKQPQPKVKKTPKQVG